MANTPAITPLLVDAPGACTMLGGISRPTLDRLRRAGAFPAVKLPGKILFDPRDLEAWRDSQKQSTWENKPPTAAIKARRTK